MNLTGRRKQKRHEMVVEDARADVETLDFDTEGLAIVSLKTDAKDLYDKDGQKPVTLVHNDYTIASGPQRVRDLIGGAEAGSLVKKRFAVINVWKPITGPVKRSPLAVCDAPSMQQADFMETDLLYPDRSGEI
jgi:hypothetical protein